MGSQCMILAPYGGGTAEDCDITGDTKTIAAAATSKGHRIIVSLHRDPFSAMSRICLRFRPGGTAKTTPAAYSTVIAVHDGSVLVQITTTTTASYSKPGGSDYFVYNNGLASTTDPARPPSLHLLPRYETDDKNWQLGASATGFLSLAGAGADPDEFTVAQLTALWAKYDATPDKAAELLLFRHGKWCAKRRRIIHGHGEDGDLLLASWTPDAVVPLGDGLLCWVDYTYGVIFSDVLDESPELRFVPYPAALERRCFVCTGARGAVKLVAVSPRRCSHCGCSEHATETDTSTWILQTAAMAWVLETETNMVDDSAEELWVLPHMSGYARQHLVYNYYPVGSMNNGGGHVVVSTDGGGGHVVSDESAAPMEEEDEHMSQSVSAQSAMPSLRDGMQGGKRGN